MLRYDSECPYAGFATDLTVPPGLATDLTVPPGLAEASEEKVQGVPIRKRVSRLEIGAGRVGHMAP